MSHRTKPVEIELKLLLPAQAAESGIVTCMRENDYRVEELDPVRHVAHEE